MLLSLALQIVSAEAMAQAVEQGYITEEKAVYLKAYHDLLTREERVSALTPLCRLFLSHGC